MRDIRFELRYQDSHKVAKGVVNKDLDIRTSSRYERLAERSRVEVGE